MPARPGEAFWGHTTRFKSRVPTASRAGLSVLLLPERSMGPELDQHRVLPSIPARASPTCTSPTAPRQQKPKGRLPWLLGCPASPRCLVQAPEANIHTYIYIYWLQKLARIYTYADAHMYMLGNCALRSPGQLSGALLHARTTWGGPQCWGLD